MIYYLAFDFHKSISSDHLVVQKEIYYIKICKYLWYSKNIVKRTLPSGKNTNIRF